MDLIMELCYYKSEGFAGDYPPILEFKPPDGIHNDKLQLNGCEATGRVSGKVCEPRPASRIQHWSAEPKAAHWCGRTPVLAVLHGLGFSKNKLLLEGDCENCGVLRARLKRNQSFSVSFYEKVMMGIFFSLFWNCGLWGEREGKHKRETALKTGLFEKALTMQALCCDLVCPHWAEQRNGKDYPQECLGCPQTEQAAWLANEREACRAAG